MTQKGLNNYFENYLKQDSIFKNRKSLQISYTPKDVPHRDEQIKTLAGILAPSLKNEKPSNLFVYGKTGTGKTLCVKHVIDHILGIAKKNKVKLKVFYLNCKLKRIADTEYRLIAQLAREFGNEVPSTGLPTDEIYKIFLKSLEEEKILLVLVLDEIDQLIHKAGDEILYNFTRLNSELKYSQISIIGVSNDLLFTDNLDPRVKSSLSEEELVFPPYNAIQLQKILKQRSKIAFKNNIVSEGVIEKCAAFAAREHGDARRALDLLRVSGELAERENRKKINIEDIDAAEVKIERDRIVDIINSQPKQFKITLYSLLLTCSKKPTMFTGDIYEHYKKICFEIGLRPLTQRRVSDIIAELDMLGIINAKVISKGRYGRTREICIAVSDSHIKTIVDMLKEGFSL